MDTQASAVVPAQQHLQEVLRSNLLPFPLTNGAQGHARLVDPSMQAEHHGAIVTMNTKQADASTRLQTTDLVLATGNELGIAKAKASKRKVVPSSSACQKLQKVDLSLETYVQVLLSVGQGLQFPGKPCSLQTLRKVLTANNLSSAGQLSKECITLHLQQLRLFKPFFSSLGSKEYKNLEVSAMAIDHSEVVEDLNALEWLEYGQVHVAPEAQCISGEETAGWRLSSACQKRHMSCWSKSLVANPTRPSGNDQQIMRSNPCEAGNADLQVATVECSNVTELPCVPYDYNWHRQTESLFDGPNGMGLEPQCPSVSHSAVSHAYATFDNIQPKAGHDVNGVISVLEIPKFAASVRKAEKISSPSRAQINTGREAQGAEISPFATQSRNIGQDAQVAEACGHCDNLNSTVLDDVTRKSLQLGSTLISQLQENTYNPFEELVSFKRREKALICSSQNALAHRESLGQNLPYLVESQGERAPILSCNRSSSDDAASHFSQPAYFQNLNREQVGNDIGNNTHDSASPSFEMGAHDKLSELSSSQNINRKEADNAVANTQSSPLFDMAAPNLAEVPCSQHYQLGRIAKEIGKDSQSREAATCKSPTIKLSDVLSSPSKLSTAAQESPNLDTVSLCVHSDHSADVNKHETMFSCPSLAEEASNRPPTPQYMGNFDAASAGFLDVLSDAASSTMGSNEDSLNLLERWQKRRHRQSSEITGRFVKSSKMLRTAGVASYRDNHESEL